MVSEPMKWVKPLQNAGASLFTFHIESTMPASSTDGIDTLIKTIKSCHMKVGIAIKPYTPIDLLGPCIQDVDLLLVMTVEPGFSGQKFMENMMEKVKKLRNLYPTMNIEVDGGVSPETVDIATEAGANVIVSASAIFGSKNPLHVIKTLRESLDRNNI
jgi:ribulose-phosphate 3-epimerase